MSTIRPRTSALAVVIAVLAFCWPLRTSAAKLFFTPGSTSVTVGQPVEVTLAVAADGQAINASQGQITWSPTMLSFDGVSKQGSIFSYWATEPTYQPPNTVSYDGGLPTPGYDGQAGTILRLTFTAQAAGTVRIILSEAIVLANDGQATNILTTTGESVLTVSVEPKTTVTTQPRSSTSPPPQIRSTNYPDPTKWYRESVVALGWTKPDGLLGVSYSVTQDEHTVPDTTRETTALSTTITLGGEGIWYLHLRGEYPDGWSAVGHYALRYDQTAPDAFVPRFPSGHEPSTAVPMLEFSAVDSGSGLASYAYSLDGGPSRQTASPITLTSLTPGSHTVTVTAYDQAGNARGAVVNFTTNGYPAPVITSLNTPLLLLDRIVVNGTARLGDRITVYIDGRALGETTAGPASAATPDSNVVAPWSLSSDRFLKPGTYTVAAVATSTSGQSSMASLPSLLKVNGQSINVYGRQLATFSVVTPLAVLLVSLLALIVLVMAKLGLSVWIMHRRVNTVEGELEWVRRANDTQALNRQQLDRALDRVEADLEGTDQPRRTRTTKRAPRRSR